MADKKRKLTPFIERGRMGSAMIYTPHQNRAPEAGFLAISQPFSAHPPTSDNDKKRK